MDIKFIGSGASAKAILYYITDYIMKSQLKTHVTYAALELAIAKLGEYNPHDDVLTLRVKSMLQKCTHAMISHQELSVQQVCLYLMDFEDHFTSHKYERPFWTSFEAFLNHQDPSLECYPSKYKDSNNVPPPDSEQNKMTSEDHEGDHGKVDRLNQADYINDTEPNEFEMIDVEDDEVVISTDEDGKIIAHTDQVADYSLRSALWKNLTLWEFISRIDKIKIPCKKKDERNEDTDRDEYNSEAEEGSDDESDELERKIESPSEISYSPQCMSCLLSSSSCICPKCDLLSPHAESATHFLCMQKPQCGHVVVPIGPGIP
jgi:uncharacterized protein YuzE